MKRLISAFVIILGCASIAWAAAPAPLTTLRAIHSLTNEQARQALPVAFEATVTYYRGYDHFLTVQDGGMAIFIKATTNARLVPGDRILVRGITRGAYRPDVLSSDITVLYHGAVPKPVPVDYEEMIRVRHDNQLVTVHAVVRSADLVSNANSQALSARLQMHMGGGDIEANLDSDDENALKGLLDAEVEATGTVEGQFDGKYQLTGMSLNVSSLANLRILRRASASPWSLPVTPMDEIFRGYHVQNLSQRIRVHGVITYYQPGSAVVLQSGARNLWIGTRYNEPLRIGDQADATGFPEVQNGFLTLILGEIQDSHIQTPITPQPATWQQLTSNSHTFDLVSIQGQVVMELRESGQDEYVLLSDGQLFSAIYRHLPAASVLPPMRMIPLGSRIRVTGISVMADVNTINKRNEMPFDILLRSFDDITVVAGPSLLSVRNLILLVGLLLAMVISAGAREWYIERKVRRQTAALAYIERRRSRILEDISGSRPLAEIVEQITELVSFKLHGAPCWCQIAEGARLGNCPSKLSALRIVEHEIPARSGPLLGMIFAGFDPLTKPSDDESEALSSAAGLATLAIETRRLYSDLLHRSEFDLLTDIHNRFSLDKYLDVLIEEARQKAGIFGLIYIDLDEFKQVNDLYGHQVGDLYLQEVALRMKRQLRSHDMLARVGGDEFAALVSVVPNRAGVEEIAVRLERCFDEPYAVEGCVLHGSASVGIALYPEDGATKDSLLSAADAAMYAAKNNKHQPELWGAEQENPALILEDPK
ncbi:MAG: GGDEF domain-containing protein [Terracidiphilus sp.]|jgi:diguanylate cyclase (GGDEF)-like protein